MTSNRKRTGIIRLDCPQNLDGTADAVNYSREYEFTMGVESAVDVMLCGSLDDQNGEHPE